MIAPCGRARAAKNENFRTHFARGLFASGAECQRVFVGLACPGNVAGRGPISARFVIEAAANVNYCQVGAGFI
jgi:hypothetical protein